MAGVQVTVSEETAKVADSFAKQQDITRAEAIDHLFAMGVSRRQALQTYAKRVADGKAGGPGKPKKAAKAKAPKKAAKKAAKKPVEVSPE